jgi:hypothetical protein
VKPTIQSDAGTFDGYVSELSTTRVFVRGTIRTQHLKAAREDLSKIPADIETSKAIANDWLCKQNIKTSEDRWDFRRLEVKNF